MRINRAFKFILYIVIGAIVIILFSSVFLYYLVSNAKLVEPKINPLTLHEISDRLNTPQLEKIGELVWSRQGLMRDDMGADNTNASYLIRVKNSNTFNFKIFHKTLDRKYLQKTNVTIFQYNIETRLLDTSKEIQKKDPNFNSSVLSITYFKAKNPNSRLDVMFDYYTTKQNDAYLKITDFTYFTRP